MKRKKLFTCAVGFLLAQTLCCSAMGAMISGLDLPVENMDRLYLVWALCALAGVLLFSFKEGGFLALTGVVLALGYLWNVQGLSIPIRAFITRLSVIYNGAYHWGVLEFAGIEWREIPLDLLLGTYGGITALVAAGAIVQGRDGLLAVILSLLPVVSTIVVTNTPAAPLWIYLLMLALVLFLLTGSVRRQDPHQGAKLAVLTALPVALVLGVLFLACPQDTYVNRSQEQLNSVVAWFQSTFSGGPSTQLGQVSGTVGGSSTATTRLTSLGPRTTLSYPVMDVTSTESGTVYLRGQDYDTYTGSTWTSGEDRVEAFAKAPSPFDNGSITIATRSIQNVLYLPYYPAEKQTLTGGRVGNEDRLTEYTFALSDPSMWITDPAVSYHGSLDEEALLPYLALPDETRAWAEPYADRVLQESSIYNSSFYFDSESLVSAKAAAIADHVQQSARYSTDTPRMDRDYDDFTQWFLEESDTGYCVHFATATAVLLRAAGVPARYVTGYMFNTEADEPVTVTADRAHAWVEYYDPVLDTWVFLESTPPDLSEEETEPTAQETTEPATEAPTEAPTESRDETSPTTGGRQPGREQDPDTDSKLDLRWLWNILKGVLILAAAAFAVLAQRIIRLNLRRRRTHSGKPNARALARWQEVERYCRLLKQEVPEDLLELAQKARFSQHQLSKEELHSFDTWFQDRRDDLKKRPWYWQLVYQYLLALW